MMKCKADSMAESVTDVIWVAAESMGYPELRCLQESAVRAFVRERYLPHEWLQVTVLFGATKHVRHSLGQAIVLGKHAILGCHALR